MHQKNESNKTIDQYDAIFNTAQQLFNSKNSDYGPSWTIMRPQSFTDQIYIKAARIRSIEEKQTQLVEDDIQDDYFGLINYCVMALIQIRRENHELIEQAQEVLDRYAEEKEAVRALMIKKNHDYGEAWRDMRVTSITDLILMKLLRIKSIENNAGQVTVSENIDAGFRDIINYAIFAMILLNE